MRPLSLQAFVISKYESIFPVEIRLRLLFNNYELFKFLTL